MVVVEKGRGNCPGSTIRGICLGIVCPGEMSWTPDPILTDAMHTAPGDRKVTEVSRGQEETYAVYCNYVCSTSSA